MNAFNLEYLQQLIENQVEENLHLDYKSSGSLGKQNDKTGEISKDVSAMANADGGILIYGIKEDESNKHFPGTIDPIIRKEFSKEWFEQTINDKIQPRINNVKIHSISISDEQVVYIIDIPKSDTAHQAMDKKYYKRFNFLSTAMYDYEIRDILNRSKNPNIELDFEYVLRSNELVVFAVNRGPVYAKYVNVKIRLPKKIVVDTHHKAFNHETVEIFADNTIRDILDIQFLGLGHTSEKYGPSRYDPILPGTRFKLEKIALQNDPFDYENIIEWEVYCDNSNPKNGSLKVLDLLTK